MLNLIDKHRELGAGSLEVIDERLVLHDQDDEDGDSEEQEVELIDKNTEKSNNFSGHPTPPHVRILALQEQQ